MDLIMAGKTVLIVGASGMLGGSILDALISSGKCTLRALVRAEKKDFARQLEGRGVHAVFGDAMHSSTLAEAVNGVDIVISALGNDPATFVPSHANLIEAAEKAGVARLIPSDFSVDFLKIEESENFNLSMRKQVGRLFEGKRLRPIHVLNGAFMDTLLDRNVPFINWQSKSVPYFGDGKQKCDFTAISDTASFVAAICNEDDPPEVVRIAGDVLTMTEFAEAASRGMSEEFVPENKGSIEDLEKSIEEKKRTASHPFEWIAWQYHHNMVTGRAKLDPLDNGRYPEVKPMTVEEFARLHGRTAVGRGQST
jgi:nucleoside-diphosphate-sugar epimerase